MSSEYPDVLGDLGGARKRFEVSGVHYVMVLEPDRIAPGESTTLRVWLQSCWNVPLEVPITVHLPAQRQSTFSIIQKRTDVPLEPAEVGEVAIPIASSVETEPGVYLVRTKVGVRRETHGFYTRSQEHAGRLEDTLLSFKTGMALSETMGLGYVARTQPEQELVLHVEGSPQSLPAPDLTPTYLSHWTVQDRPIQGKAREYVNDQRLYLLPKITRQALYVAFLGESQHRFKHARLPLEIGEAIFLAKILTYTVEYFLARPSWQDVVLVPAYGLAYRYELPVDDPVLLVARADYPRVARLAISLSFGLLQRYLGREPWILEEQVALADLVSNRVEHGGMLPCEFLYLPLLLGGLLVAHEVQMPGEDLAESIELLTKASRVRGNALAENPQLVEVFALLLEAALREVQSL
jgi:hypothetical protein